MSISYNQTAHNVSTKSAEQPRNQRTMYALSPDGKFLVKFFSKNLRGQEGQSPRKTALFFLRSFFFCASCVKRKSERMTFDVAMTQRTMFAI